MLPCSPRFPGIPLMPSGPCGPKRPFSPLLPVRPMGPETDRKPKERSQTSSKSGLGPNSYCVLLFQDSGFSFLALTEKIHHQKSWFMDLNRFSIVGSQVLVIL